MDTTTQDRASANTEITSAQDSITQSNTSQASIAETADNQFTTTQSNIDGINITTTIPTNPGRDGIIADIASTRSAILA